MEKDRFSSLLRELNCYIVLSVGKIVQTIRFSERTPPLLFLITIGTLTNRRIEIRPLDDVASISKGKRYLFMLLILPAIILASTLISF